jgi:hypothetical protein
LGCSVWTLRKIIPYTDVYIQGKGAKRMQVALATQPESMNRLISRSFKLYLKGLPRVFIFSLLLSLIVFFPRIYAQMASQELNASLIISGMQSLWLLLIEFGVLYVFTSMLWRVRCVLHQEHESIFADLKIAIKKLPLIIAAALIQAFILSSLAAVALIFGFYLTQNQTIFVDGVQSNWVFLAGLVLAFNVWVSIYIYYLLIFYLPLILTEDKGIIAAIKQSIVLVWCNWWRTFLFLTFPWLCYVVCLIVIRNFFKLDLHIYFIEPIGHSNWFAIIAHIFIFAIFIPWIAAALLIQLRDLELRKKVG